MLTRLCRFRLLLMLVDDESYQKVHTLESSVGWSPLDPHDDDDRLFRCLCREEGREGMKKEQQIKKDKKRGRRRGDWRRDVAGSPVSRQTARHTGSERERMKMRGLMRRME